MAKIRGGLKGNSDGRSERKKTYVLEAEKEVVGQL